MDQDQEENLKDRTMFFKVASIAEWQTKGGGFCNVY